MAPDKAEGAADAALPPLQLLADSCGWLALRFAAEPLACGDHDVVICRVVAWHTPTAPPPTPPLTTGHLRALGLL